MLRKPTEWLRVTVDQNGRVHVDNKPIPNGGPAIPPEAGAAEGTYRRLQICVPASPPIDVSLMLPPNEAGPSRTDYKWAPAPPDKMITLRLQPHQELYVSAAQGGGFAVMSIIVEYCEGEG